MMSRDEITQTFATHDIGADISIIEGNKGLYDGLDLDGSNSNAALATHLAAPVILVIDTRGMTRGIAPLLLGYQQFDSGINIAGVILNNVGGSRHEEKLSRIIGHYTDIQVIGAVHHDKNLQIRERHLGLMPCNELDEAHETIERIRQAIEDQVDLDRVISIANTAPSLQRTELPAAAEISMDLRIGIARDAAFGFYYPGDLDKFRLNGAEIIEFSTIDDKVLPVVDGIFLGGGFPETQMQALQANVTLREDIRAAIENGLPVYAECGGLMYLCRSLQWNDEKVALAGVIPADVIMHERPQGRGYTRLQETDDSIWPDSNNSPGSALNAHEFHYSGLQHMDEDFDCRYAFNVLRGHGVDGEHDGIIYKNMLACYSHQQDHAMNPWVTRFVNFVRKHKQAN